MQPYGRVKKTTFPGKQDHHVHGIWKRQWFMNWWEADRDNIVARSTLKRMAMMEEY